MRKEQLFALLMAGALSVGMAAPTATFAADAAAETSAEGELDSADTEEPSEDPAETPAEGTEAGAQGEQAEATGELPTVGVLIYKYDDTYISTVRNALETALNGKAEIIMQDGKGDQATPNAQLDVMIEKGVDVLCGNMVDAKAASGVVEKA